VATTADNGSLTVAITGPTGEIGRSVVDALERSREVGRILGMARRPFDPESEGWSKTAYRRGDILDRRRVAALVEEADVVVHLAFLIMGSVEQTRRVNLDGSRYVFEAAAAARVKRLVYTSSVAAYGFAPGRDLPLTEAEPALGSEDLYYSAQKAEVEQTLADTLYRTPTKAWVLRPCIVAGPRAPLIVDSLPFARGSGGVLGHAQSLLGALPGVRPVLPDPGTPFQLVHHDDVATAVRAAVLGRGKPGPYNIAGPGEISIGVLARELGWYSVPVPELAVEATKQIVRRLGFLPSKAQWLAAFSEPVVMDTARARRELKWRPKHDALDTLRETIAAARGADAADAPRRK
jgi:nucleoside-diphosphate-sugar epimerase